MGGGFEPPKASPTDLQSVPFDHSGTPPYQKSETRNQKPDIVIWLLSSGFWLLNWSWRWDLNPQPPDYKSGALPIELRQHEPEKYIPKSEKINSFFMPTVIKKAGGKIPPALQAQNPVKKNYSSFKGFFT